MSGKAGDLCHKAPGEGSTAERRQGLRQEGASCTSIPGPQVLPGPASVGTCENFLT